MLGAGSQRARDLGERLEDQRAGAVADAMNARLEASRRHPKDPRLQLARIEQPEPGIPWIVLVGVEHRRPAAAQRAIREELHATHAEGSDGTPLAPGTHLVVELRPLPVDHRVDAEGKLVALRKPRVGVEHFRPGARIVHGGETRGSERVERAKQHLLALARRRPGNGPQDQIHGGVDQHAGRHAIVAAQDAAARRVRRRGDDARGSERVVVAPQRVNVDPRERHRMPRSRRAEQ